MTKKATKSKVQKLQVKTETAKDLRVSSEKGGNVKGGARCGAFPGSQAATKQNCAAIFSQG